MVATLSVSRSDFRKVQKVDESPDLSFLGEYSDSLEDGGIDREERGDKGRGEYRYFNPGCGDPEYIEQDYERFEAYNRGDWCMMGVWAEVDVTVNGTIQTIRTPGLWGIESDSGDYVDEVYEEECNQLVGILEEMGIEVTD